MSAAAVRLYDLAEARGRKKTGPKPIPASERFWRHVDKGDGTGCWLWTGSKDDNGYGSFNSGAGTILAHRFSYLLAHGVLPLGMNVCHSCDNPPCVNPAHFFLGRQLENIRDCMAKGRLNNSNRARTHCQRGHKLPEPDARGWRQCSECKVERQRARRAERRAAR